MAQQLPTPEQQRATAEKFRGQGAKQVFETREIPSAASEAPSPPMRLRGAWKHTLWQWLVRSTLISVLAFVVGIVLTVLNTDQQSGAAHNQFLNTVSGVLLAPVFVLALIWVFVIIGGILWSIHVNLRVAVKPIPSLAEINSQLRAEGYTPSLQDIIAVEQHLKSERNEAALIAGGLIVGLHAMAREAKGKPPF